MGIEFCFVLWIIILVVVFFIVRSFGVRWWSSLVFALVVAWILLVVLFPMDHVFNLFGIFHGKDRDGHHDRDCDRDDCDDRDCGRHEKDCSGGWLFCFITLLTVVIVIVYLIQRVFRDREENCDGNTMGRLGWW